MALGQYLNDGRTQNVDDLFRGEIEAIRDQPFRHILVSDKTGKRGQEQQERK